MTPFGIYGYIFTKEMTFDLGILTPRFNNLHEIKKEKMQRRVLYTYRFFTPNSSANKNLSQALFDLSAILSFIEQKM